MKKNILFICGFLLLFTACQSNHDEEIKFEDFSNPIEELTGMERDVAIDIIASRYGGYKYGEIPTRTVQDFSLSPYVVDGDTVFYVAQYANGWDLYSANHATSKVLFSSDEGVFDINDPSMPSQLRFLIEQNANEIANLSKEDISYVDPSWGGIAVTDEIINNAQTMVLGIGGGYVPLPNTGTYPPGHWILLEADEIGTDTYTSPKLTKTEWGQQSPWNSYAKWVFNDKNNLVQAVNGCSSVAISQYMYFTHFKDGTPANSVTSASLSSDGKDYNFYGSSSDVWNRMAINERGISEYKNNTALLIGKTGRLLKTDYGYNGSSTYSSNELKLLKDTYGGSFSIIDLSSTKIKGIINNGYPVIASARTNKTSSGKPYKPADHLFLIDQYQETTKTYKYTYALVRDKSQVTYPNPWIDDLKDANGNIIKYAYTKETSETSVYSSKISMNWGENGSSNSTFYSPTENWDAIGYIFNLHHVIYVKDN